MFKYTSRPIQILQLISVNTALIPGLERCLHQTSIYAGGAECSQMRLERILSPSKSRDVSSLS